MTRCFALMHTTPKELARFALYAAVAELADAQDLKSCGTYTPVSVRFRSPAYFKKFVGIAQLDRAFGYGPKGRGFESSNARHIKNGTGHKVLSHFLFESGRTRTGSIYISFRSLLNACHRHAAASNARFSEKRTIKYSFKKDPLRYS